MLTDSYHVVHGLVSPFRNVVYSRATIARDLPVISISSHQSAGGEGLFSISWLGRDPSSRSELLTAWFTVVEAPLVEAEPNELLFEAFETSVFSCKSSLFKSPAMRVCEFISTETFLCQRPLDLKDFVELS